MPTTPAAGRPVGEDEPRHPIAAAARLARLSPHVLRAWERRYGAVTPARTGPRRLYSDRDVRRLELLAVLTGLGYSIGSVAGLDDGELAGLAARAADAGRGPLTAVDGDPLERCLACVGAMDVRGFAAELERCRLRLGLTAFATELLAPLMTRIGHAWENQRLTPAHEHLASAVVRRSLDNAVRSFELLADGPLLLATTPSGDRHELGALMAAAAAAAEGWRVLYLGSDLPAADVALAARRTGASALLLSLSAYEGAARRDDLRQLGKLLPASTAWLVGGQGTERWRDLLVALGARVTPLQELAPALQQLSLEAAG